MTETLPIIYVRGFAGMTGGINQAVDDPFYGFNAGSTHVRVGGGGEPHFYQFEGPLLRLIEDEGYEIRVHGDQARYLEAQPDGSVLPSTIWIHRFYDEAASTWTEKAKPFSLEEAAKDLQTLIGTVLRKTGAPRVHLVAHSMGGLICRSLIQKVIPETKPTKPATDTLESLFTYATPHGGITFSVGLGIIEGLRDFLDVAGSDIFGPDRMYSYLTPSSDVLKGGPPKQWHARDMPDTPNFPLERVFCLIGTNPEDYGPSSKIVGVKSDGLVQIENAYVPGANHAYVHRSHSGRYGIVNSEEGYQNLRRFLFGDIKVTANLTGLQLPQGESDVVWQADVQLAIRGLDPLLHEQTAAHHCPVILMRPDDESDRPIPLTTSFLETRLAPKDQPSRYSVHVRILSVRESGGIFHLGQHLEQTADFDDYLIIDLEPRKAAFAVWAVWQSSLGHVLADYKPEGDPLEDKDQRAGAWQASVRLPAQAMAKFGKNAAVHLAATRRTGAE
jgi:hypothetical protein